MRRDAPTTAIKTIRLDEYSTAGTEDGSRIAYVFVAPLDGEGRLDRDQWAINRHLCVVRRFENGEEAGLGEVIVDARGRWSFSYFPGDDGYESADRLGFDCLTVGAYVSITEDDGIQRSFTVSATHTWNPVRSAFPDSLTLAPKRRRPHDAAPLS